MFPLTGPTSFIFLYFFIDLLNGDRLCVLEQTKTRPENTVNYMDQKTNCQKSKLSEICLIYFFPNLNPVFTTINTSINR